MSQIERKYYLSKENSEIFFELNTKEINHCTKSEYLRYLKGVHTNKDRFIHRYINPRLEMEKFVDAEFFADIKYLLDFFVENYDEAITFSFKEAFSLKNDSFRALSFSSINIIDMMAELGAKRYKTDGIEVNHKKFDKEGNFIDMEKYHNIYEVYEISGKKLDLEENVYAIKCWCTSTNKEHFIWIDSKYKDDPLNAIASTFMIHKNLIPYIKELKRQGDVLLVELTEKIEPTGEIVSLDKDQYFGLLTAQS